MIQNFEIGDKVRIDGEDGIHTIKEIAVTRRPIGWHSIVLMEHAVRAGLFRASYGHTIIPNEKLHEVIGLRRLGFTYGEIGRMFGISSHAAKSIFDGSRELSRIAGDELNERVSKFVEDNKDKSMFIKGRRLNKNGAPYRCVVQIDKNGNYVRRFDSIKTAAEANGVLHSAIINNLKGRSKFCGGYKYVYE